MALADLDHSRQLRCGNQHPRRAFMEQQQLRPEAAIQRDGGANARFERALSESPGQTAVAQVVRRFGQSRDHDFAHGFVNPLLELEIDFRRQTPHLLQHLLGFVQRRRAAYGQEQAKSGKHPIKR